MDKIIIQGLQVKSLIGVYDWERERPQALLVDVEISMDLHLAASTDNIAETLDYAALANDLSQLAQDSQFELLEALADCMIAKLLSYKGVQAVTLRVTKPNILDNADSVSVQLSRHIS